MEAREEAATASSKAVLWPVERGATGRVVADPSERCLEPDFCPPRMACGEGGELACDLAPEGPEVGGGARRPDEERRLSAAGSDVFLPWREEERDTVEPSPEEC